MCSLAIAFNNSLCLVEVDWKELMDTVRECLNEVSCCSNIKSVTKCRKDQVEWLSRANKAQMTVTNSNQHNFNLRQEPSSMEMKRSIGLCRCEQIQSNSNEKFVASCQRPQLQHWLRFRVHNTADCLVSYVGQYFSVALCRTFKPRRPFLSSKLHFRPHLGKVHHELRYRCWIRALLVARILRILWMEVSFSLLSANFVVLKQDSLQFCLC